MDEGEVYKSEPHAHLLIGYWLLAIGYWLSRLGYWAIVGLSGH
jgi:hypothetical protein